MQRVKLHPRAVVGHPVPRIVEIVKQESFDLLIIGLMGQSALYERIIGSTTDRLVRLAPCAVLVVK
jgi:nucleotide-binding universal stress UspA family protein